MRKANLFWGFYGTNPFKQTRKGKQPGKHVVVIRATSPGRGQPYGLMGSVEETASTAIHELEHVRQFKTYEKRPKIAKRMQKGRYEKRREEVLAREAEAKAERKRYGLYERGTKYFWPMFRKMTEDEEEEHARNK